MTKKLQELFERNLLSAIRAYGFPTARKLSVLAQNWGNKIAREWNNDNGFAWYLVFMRFYGHPIAIVSGK